MSDSATSNRSNRVIIGAGVLFVLIAATILVARVLRNPPADDPPTGAQIQQATTTDRLPIEVTSTRDVPTATPEEFPEPVNTPQMAAEAPGDFTYQGLRRDTFRSYQAEIAIEEQSLADSDFEWWSSQWGTLSVQTDPPGGQLVLTGGDNQRDSFHQITTFINALLYFYEAPSEEPDDPDAQCSKSPGLENWQNQLPIAIYLDDTPNYLLNAINFPPGWKLVEEDVQDTLVPTTHYTLEQFSSYPFTDTTADIWVSQNDEIPIKFELSGMAMIGRQGAIMEGWLYILYEVKSFNEPLDITLPPLCRTGDG